MKMKLLLRNLCISSLVSAIIAMACPALAADNAPLAVSGNSVQITKQTSMNQIRALPDHAQIRTPNGRVMSAQRFKTLADAIAAARKISPAGKPHPQFAFSRTQANAQVQLKPGVNLKEIAKRPDNDVLQLPDGRKITVGDLKKLSVIQQKRTGQSLLDVKPAAQRPSREGPAIKVNSKAELNKLADKPDSTILESRTGKRITLGELRAHAKAQGRAVGELK